MVNYKPKVMVTEIENFKLKEFLQKDEELIRSYIVVLNYLKPIQTKKEIYHMKLKHVDSFKENIYSDDDRELIKIVAKTQGVKVTEVYEMKIIKFFQLINSIKKQIEQINLAEANAFVSTKIDFGWQAVDGDEKMKKFGIFNTLESLSSGDVLKYNKILNLPYSFVFTTLVMKKTYVDLKREANEIEKQKNKTS